MDYNIYLHDTESVESSDPTKPWTSSSDGKSNFEDNFTRGVQKATGIMQNPDGIIAGAVGKAMKALPYVAAAYAVFKLTDAVITTANQFITAETGDYRFETQYNNFKAGLSACFRPFSTTVNYFKVEQQIRLENNKKAANRELFGDSMINGGLFYGV